MMRLMGEILEEPHVIENVCVAWTKCWCVCVSFTMAVLIIALEFHLPIATCVCFESALFPGC